MFINEDYEKYVEKIDSVLSNIKESINCYYIHRKIGVYMSIDVSAKIQKNFINVKDIELYIKDFFLVIENLNKQSLGNVTMFSDFYNDNKIIIYFTENENAVYNSLFFKDEFKYSQSLLFDIKKDNISTKEFVTIINFCKYIRKRINSDILITSNVHDEICIVKINEIIFSDAAKELKKSYS